MAFSFFLLFVFWGFKADSSFAYAPEIPRNLTLEKSFVKDLSCISKAVYDEANGEPFAGKLAVAHVIMNRSEKAEKPPCKIVFQQLVPGICQFSGMCGKKVFKESAESRQAAFLVLSKSVKDNTKGSTHFHATYVSPSWSNHYERTRRIGGHVFYRPKQNT